MTDLPPSSRPARTTRAPQAVIEALRLLTVVFFAGAGYAIGRLGFPATYVAIAATMSLATVLLWTVSRRAQTSETQAAAPEPA